MTGLTLLQLYAVGYGPLLFALMLRDEVRHKDLTLRTLLLLAFVCLTPIVNILATMMFLMSAWDDWMDENGDRVVIRKQSQN